MMSLFRTMVTHRFNSNRSIVLMRVIGGIMALVGKVGRGYELGLFLVSGW
jgi:hypothetical protein